MLTKIVLKLRNLSRGALVGAFFFLLVSGFAVEAAAACPADGIVAFSAGQSYHISEGAKTELYYSNTTTKVGGGWYGSVFIAPCDGLYVFTVSFVKNSYPSGATTDDVYLSIVQNGSQDLGSAWAGETPVATRVTATHTVSVLLTAGEYIQTFVTSDSGKERHVRNASITGYLVKAASTP